MTRSKLVNAVFITIIVYNVTIKILILSLPTIFFFFLEYQYELHSGEQQYMVESSTTG